MANVFDVAVVGATGAVGQVMLEILEERDFPVRNMYPLASPRSAGKTVQFKGRTITIEDLTEFDFSQVQIGLFSAGGDISKDYAPKAAEAGCVVVDNTSYFRQAEGVPLVIPEVNGHRIADYTNRGIIANPNCSTIQMLVALKPLHDFATIERINVATYQAVSGSGNAAVSELADQSARLLNGQPIEEPTVYPKQIAFNVLPHIDDFMDNGYTKEEMKMVWETGKILENENVLVNPTTARVPVFYGHSEALHIETSTKVTAAKARELFDAAAGTSVMDTREPGGYATAAIEGATTDDVFVSRIREDLTADNGLDFWVVSDNVRKGAALNTIQIAERLAADYLS
ncbi:aspartate-semialdehyde dehydrogenase [Salinisphaera sp. USBA-960]|uniref:aspartate-semialdehyde dehydrogenase n=1 Tax=Salinisphaera orenii TaxID=856731 RepID=UPI000DBE4E44|nr:aspartate-semialdehyde dehydrogenase [Salifodinibacter halophilus]NNC26101.1 aspartate-semialdehyde dehydrogenase [Salifodinibacter halophilus]